MEKRCAYFGCMSPMFHSENPRQKYCCRKCCTLANTRSERSRATQNARHAAIMANPALRKKKSRRSSRAAYLAGRLPRWMYD